MAIDRGIALKALRRARRLNKAKGFFIEKELGAYHGFVVRAVRYGIFEKAEIGYRLVNPSQDPVLAYKMASNRHSPRGKRGPYKQRTSKELIVAGRNGGENTGPAVKVMQYDETHDLLIVGKKIYLAIEVVLTPRRQQHG